MTARFAQALSLIGLIALTVFVTTYMNQEGDVRSLLLGASLCALGLILRRRVARREQAESGRFRMLRRLSGRDEEDDN
jgi:hypothetical protein